MSMLDEFRSRRIRIFRNGDVFSAPKKYVVSSRIFRNFEQFLLTVSEDLALSNGAVRRIYTIEGASVVDLLELHEGQDYVATAGESFMHAPYPTDGVSYLEPWMKSVKKPVYDPVENEKERAERERQKLDKPLFKPSSKAYRVVVFPNGEPDHQPLILTLNYRNCKSFDQLLGLLSSTMKLKSGYVRKLYDAATGEVVRNLQEIKDGQNLVAGTWESFRQAMYPAINPIINFTDKKEPEFIDHLNATVDLPGGRVTKVFTMEGEELDSINDILALMAPDPSPIEEQPPKLKSIAEPRQFVISCGDDPFYAVPYDLNRIQARAGHAMGLGGATTHNDFIDRIRKVVVTYPKRIRRRFQLQLQQRKQMQQMQLRNKLSERHESGDEHTDRQSESEAEDYADDAELTGTEGTMTVLPPEEGTSTKPIRASEATRRSRTRTSESDEGSAYSEEPVESEDPNPRKSKQIMSKKGSTRTSRADASRRTSRASSKASRDEHGDEIEEDESIRGASYRDGGEEYGDGDVKVFGSAGDLGDSAGNIAPDMPRVEDEGEVQRTRLTTPVFATEVGADVTITAASARPSNVKPARSMKSVVGEHPDPVSKQRSKISVAGEAPQVGKQRSRVSVADDEPQVAKQRSRVSVAAEEETPIQKQRSRVSIAAEQEAPISKQRSRVSVAADEGTAMSTRQSKVSVAEDDEPGLCKQRSKVSVARDRSNASVANVAAEAERADDDEARPRKSKASKSKAGSKRASQILNDQAPVEAGEYAGEHHADEHAARAEYTEEYMQDQEQYASEGEEQPGDEYFSDDVAGDGDRVGDAGSYGDEVFGEGQDYENAEQGKVEPRESVGRDTGNEAPEPRPLEEVKRSSNSVVRSSIPVLSTRLLASKEALNAALAKPSRKSSAANRLAAEMSAEGQAAV